MSKYHRSRCSNIPGSGVVIGSPGSCTDNSDTVTGSSKDEYFDLKSGDDACYAGAGDDIVVGAAGNDTVYGGSGTDEIKGDGGNDSLDGGDGDDTAVYAGTSSEYEVTYVAPGSFTIADSKTGTGSEGTDSLSGVEFAKFGDGLFSLGAGGLTAVTPPGPAPANTPGLVHISGIGAEGNTLTATVSDPDGISGPVNYQWQVSVDNGQTWTDIYGATGNTYVVSAEDKGSDLQVLAQYIDKAPHTESPVSASKAIAGAGGGDLAVTLMHPVIAVSEARETLHGVQFPKLFAQTGCAFVTRKAHGAVAVQQ